MTKKKSENRQINMTQGNYNENIEGNYIQGDFNQVNIYNQDSFKQEQNFPETQRIFQVVANFFKTNPSSGTGDREISQALGINIHKVRVCLQELSKQELIKLCNADNLSGERLIVIGLTSQGWIAEQEN